MEDRLTVKETVKGDIERVFNAFTDGDELVNWHSASPGWTTPYAYSDLTPGGKLIIAFKDPDGEHSFEYEGYYTEIHFPDRIAYKLGDDREVEIILEEKDGNVEITEHFTPDPNNPHEMQIEGWKAILSNLKKYIEE